MLKKRYVVNKKKKNSFTIVFLVFFFFSFITANLVKLSETPAGASCHCNVSRLAYLNKKINKYIKLEGISDHRTPPMKRDFNFQLPSVDLSMCDIVSSLLLSIMCCNKEGAKYEVMEWSWLQVIQASSAPPLTSSCSPPHDWGQAGGEFILTYVIASEKQPYSTAQPWSAC